MGNQINIKDFIGIIGTLSGVIIGGLITLFVAHIQLRNQEKQRREEREFSAKHKALLSAAESVTRFLNYYMTLSDRELPKDGTIPDEVSEMQLPLTVFIFIVIWILLSSQ